MFLIVFACLALLISAALKPQKEKDQSALLNNTKKPIQNNNIEDANNTMEESLNIAFC